MSKHDFLLEIGVEEMPARFVEDSLKQLASGTENWLQERRIAYDDLHTYATPRRLAVFVGGIAEKQEDQKEEVKGPAQKIAKDEDGNWSKAVLGFAKSQGVAPEDLYIKEFKGNEYLYATKHKTGATTEDLLPQIKTVVTSLSFPNKMRWGDHEFSFIRPIRWITALYGTEVVPLEIAGISSGNQTEGHRFLGEKVTLERAQDYVPSLVAQYVIPDVEERQQMIRSQLEQLQEKMNWDIVIDLDLLDEVTHLVEYPTAIYGSFDEEFLTVPREVLITSMKEHQRYFPVQDLSGKLLPYFVTIRNGKEDPQRVVSRGNEKVLRARLADARFFYAEDQKLDIDFALSQLEHVVFHEELGSMGDKVRRIRKIATKLARELELDEATLQQVDRAGELCKFDLVTQMVDEFPELQGKMGEEYAKLAGEEKDVAQAIYEHYLPRFARDELPQTDMGGIVSIADKIDTISTCFSIGLVPTGSQDPYALRRQAAGIVQIILANQWPINIHSLSEQTLRIFSRRQLIKRTEEEIKGDLAEFFNLRLKNRLQEQNVRYDVIDAVLPSHQGDILSLFSKADVLMQQVEEETFKPLVEAFTRVNNLAQKLPENVQDIQPERFEANVEHDLFETYTQVHTQFEESVQTSDWKNAFQALSQLKKPIENYFEEVMVMTADDQVRYNRLALLQQITRLIKRYADFSKIVFSSEKASR